MVLIGKKIKEYRKKCNLSQSEFAERIGVAKSSVAAYENDSRVPSYDVLMKMINVFGVGFDSFLLDESETMLNVTGLTEEQVEIVRNLIAYFKTH